jgi:hypothetical protein
MMYGLNSRLQEWFHLPELLPAACGILVQPFSRRPDVSLIALEGEPCQVKGLKAMDFDDVKITACRSDTKSLTWAFPM